jgi:hypothetical protein
VCISEHSGAISVAWRGVLLEHLDEGKLRSELSRLLRLSLEEETAELAGADGTTRPDPRDTTESGRASA